MINFNDVTKLKTNRHNSNWPQYPDHSCKKIIIESSESG